MRVGELKDLGFQTLYEKAFQYTEEYGRYDNPNNASFRNAFNWSRTPEGHDFWSDISNVSFNSRAKIRVNSIILSHGYKEIFQAITVFNDGVAVQKNGLFA